MGFHTDWLWFRGVRFASVFVTVLQTQVLLGAVTAAVFFLRLYGNVTLVGDAEAALGNLRALWLDHEPPLATGPSSAPRNSTSSTRSC